MLDLTAALRRRTAATLPWATRTANMFFHLRIAVTSVPDGFGQVANGIFSLLGVTEMLPLENPPVNLRQIDNRHVPPAYGRDLGRRGMGWAMKRLKNKEKAEEFLIAFLGHLTDKAKRGLLRAIEGKPLDQAEKFLFTMMNNYLMDQRRSEGRRPHDDAGNEDLSDLGDTLGDSLNEAASVDIDHAAQQATKAITSRWPDSGITEDDVRTYLELISDDVSDAQIIGGKMLPFLEGRTTFSPAAWTKYKRTILDAVKTDLKTASWFVRDLDEGLVFASEETQAAASILMEKTASMGKAALEPGTVLRLNYDAQLETLHSMFVGAAGQELYKHVNELHRVYADDPRFEGAFGFTSWDYGSPRNQSGKWAIRVWLKSSPTLVGVDERELDANLDLQIDFGDKVEVELKMGNREAIFKKSFSKTQASPSVIAAYCGEAWSKLLVGR